MKSLIFGLLICACALTFGSVSAEDMGPGLNFDLRAPARKYQKVNVDFSRYVAELPSARPQLTLVERVTVLGYAPNEDFSLGWTAAHPRRLGWKKAEKTLEGIMKTYGTLFECYPGSYLFAGVAPGDPPRRP